MAKPYRLLRARMSQDAQQKAQALADRVWARQAPSSRWRVVPPEDDAREKALTLQDLIEFLRDETERQTLTEQAITRCMLLAFDLGMAAGEARMSPPAPGHPVQTQGRIDGQA